MFEITYQRVTRPLSLWSRNIQTKLFLRIGGHSDQIIKSEVFVTLPCISSVLDSGLFGAPKICKSYGLFQHWFQAWNPEEL